MKQLALVEIDNEFFGTRFHKLSELLGLGELVSLVIKIIFIVAGVGLLVFFIIGGIGMITSAGSGNPEGAEKAKKAVTSAVIGFMVVFVAYWIVQLIELWTGIKIF
jgi:hypothetical protein